MSTEQRARLWKGRWWILAALSGAASIWSVMTLLHDTRQPRAAAGLVAQATAEQIAALATARFAAVPLEVLAPLNGRAGATPRAIAQAEAVANRVFALVLAPDTNAFNRLVRLDSLSVRASASTLGPLFGTLDTLRPYRGTAHLAGPVAGVTIDVALASGQIAYPLVGGISTRARNHMALLLLVTLVALGAAIGATRREMQLTRARSDFIAGVSHDLRMPLAQVLLAGETLALDRARNDSARALLASSIVRETRRLIGLVENVLLFARSGAVAVRPVLVPLTVADLFREASDAVSLAAEDAGQTIDARPGVVDAVLGDSHLVRQALVNLMDNALKYGSAGQSVRLRAETGGIGLARLVVEDDGPGVPVSERERVFEPYERLQRDRSSERTGSGLGLAVVRTIAEACGGKIWLESAEGGGTRAVLELKTAAHDVRAPEGEVAV